MLEVKIRERENNRKPIASNKVTAIYYDECYRWSGWSNKLFQSDFLQPNHR